ncbi:MAG TPA: anti-sigma regulatory factor, partial [Verrucomicrobiae bacterium]|nr:anti-sigma regulatory factor [Verrucomicrobiae bacterium]
TAAISEIGRNILDYARHGEILIEAIRHGQRKGIKITARDDGPGIADVRQAMQCGFSTRNRPGVGLPGTKWLMDEFDIESKVGKGTVITMKKWAENADGENQWLPLDI